MNFLCPVVLYTGKFSSGEVKIHTKKFRVYTIHEIILYMSIDSTKKRIQNFI